MSRELQQSIRDRTSEQTRVFKASVVRKLRMKFIRRSSRNAPLHTFRNDVAITITNDVSSSEI